MQTIIKLAIALAIILICTQIGKKLPSLAGLIATMPLTGAIVLVWLYSDDPGNYDLMRTYTKGALWGIVPSILFFTAAFVCFRNNFTLPATLSVSFSIWVLSAIVHQWLLK